MGKVGKTQCVRDNETNPTVICLRVTASISDKAEHTCNCLVHTVSDLNTSAEIEAVYTASEKLRILGTRIAVSTCQSKVVVKALCRPDRDSMSEDYTLSYVEVATILMGQNP